MAAVRFEQRVALSIGGTLMVALTLVGGALLWMEHQFLMRARLDWLQGQAQAVAARAAAQIDEAAAAARAAAAALDAMRRAGHASRPHAIHGFYPPIAVYQAMLEKVTQASHSLQ